jgi:carboxyl-terminal processing protease
MKKYLIVPISLILLATVSCLKEDSNPPEPVEEAVSLDNEINDFVWKGLNDVYYWQSDVPNLADTKDYDKDYYYTYLNSYSNPEALFESLLYEKGSTDRFSWYIEDYNEQSASDRGISDSFGFDFGLSKLCSTCNEVIGYITYVIPNSPASDAGIKRGDIFYKFNDTELNLDNYSVVNGYYSDSFISMGFATLTDTGITPNGVSADLSLREVVENPVFYSDVITNDQGKKIGYLVYNSFKYTFHSELNQIFATFKNENVDELVLDLRYNGGGRAITASYLASMIHAEAAAGDVFMKLTFNSKNARENSSYDFADTANIYDKDGDYSGNQETINRLTGLTRMFVITSRNTASASESIINGLSPFIDVIKVGTTTYGKNVGSFTVFDSPDFTQNNVNPNHTVAMQPITFKYFNKLDQSDFTLGFEPDYELIEYISDMKPFGDLNEPLLQTCLSVISGNVSKVQAFKRPEFSTEEFFNSLDKKRYSKQFSILNQ